MKNVKYPENIALTIMKIFSSFFVIPLISLKSPMKQWNFFTNITGFLLLVYGLEKYKVISTTGRSENNSILSFQK